MTVKRWRCAQLSCCGLGLGERVGTEDDELGAAGRCKE